MLMGAEHIKPFESLYKKAVEAITQAVTTYALKLLVPDPSDDSEDDKLAPVAKPGAGMLQWTDLGWPILPRQHNGKEIVGNGIRQKVVHAYFSELYSE